MQKITIFFLKKAIKIIPLIAFFLHINAYGSLAYLAFEEGYWQVFAFTNNKTHAKQITFSEYDKSVFSWYPDGQNLLINASSGRLFKVNIKTGQEHVIDFPYRGFFDAVLSPDGHWITFSFSGTGEPDDSAIWITAISDSGASDSRQFNMRKLTNMPGLQHSPRWHPDGKTIYFASNSRTEVNGLWSVDTMTGLTMQLAANTYRNFDMVYAESINGFAFTDNRAGNLDIWIKTVGQPAINLSSHAASDYQVTFSGRGDAYFVSSRDNGNLNIWHYLRDKELIKQLTHHKNGARYPVWRQP